jgi:hypothetical protein
LRQGKHSWDAPLSHWSSVETNEAVCPGLGGPGREVPCHGTNHAALTPKTATSVLSDAGPSDPLRAIHRPEIPGKIGNQPMPIKRGKGMRGFGARVNGGRIDPRAYCHPRARRRLQCPQAGSPVSYNGEMASVVAGTAFGSSHAQRLPLGRGSRICACGICRRPRSSRRPRGMKHRHSGAVFPCFASLVQKR